MGVGLGERKAGCLDGIEVALKDAATAAWTDVYWVSPLDKESAETTVVLTVVGLVVHLEYMKADCLDGIEVASKDAPTAAWTDERWVS